MTAADLRGIQYGDTDRQRLESVFRILDPLINGRALHVPVADAFSADTPVPTEPDGPREGICQPGDLSFAFQFELIPGMSKTYACSICGREVGEVTESHRTERSRTATSHQPAASSISTDERIAALIDKHLRHRSPADLVCRDELLAALMPNVGSR
ncbi:hypothetical protein F1C58_16235 (plasmid) [Glaciihabitans sp. INWT7]|uniref:hypothetical protein n=1 Tax=Glaciihabitans sp. INWT7 TaxID=2596912 RepID=UPI00162A5A92|nr:hypothetical protein [Glaciihabitans sp. INWT7]QNE48608.1 hypothetical protein F1C58_16235 [Glaciihabitans sp. INWT7]